MYELTVGMDQEETPVNRVVVVSLVVLSQGFGIGVVVLMSVWLSDHLGGFAWDGSGKQFNAHPLCMTISLIYLYGTAILIYRVFPGLKKIQLKIVHALLLLLALVGAIVGLVAVFQFHNAQKIKNLYTLHSWCGLITLALFALQYLAGFSFFVLPRFSEEMRASYLGLHQYVGRAILICTGITAISGINEKLFFVKNYPDLSPGAMIANFCGVLIVAFICLVLFIVQKPDWKRREGARESANLLSE